MDIKQKRVDMIKQAYNDKRFTDNQLKEMAMDYLLLGSIDQVHYDEIMQLFVVEETPVE